MAEHCAPSRGHSSESSSEDEFYDTLSEVSRDARSRGEVSSGRADTAADRLQPAGDTPGESEDLEGNPVDIDGVNEDVTSKDMGGVEGVKPAGPSGDDSASNRSGHIPPSPDVVSAGLKDPSSAEGRHEQGEGIHDAGKRDNDESRTSTAGTDGEEQPAGGGLSGDTFHEGLAAEAVEPEGSEADPRGLGGGPGGGTEEVDGGGEDEDGEESLRQLEGQLTEEEKQERKDEAQRLKKEGNDLYKSEEYLDAIHQYTEAIKLCPLEFKKERSIMFANRAACKIHLEQLEAAVKDCTKALDLHQHYMKVLLRRAQTYELLEKLDEALADYQRALELDPGCHTARAACMRLPEQINERNEKLKAEMLDKLKGLGNMVLRPFGLSTDNFQMQQDPSTGSYSVNFVQDNKTNGK